MARENIRSLRKLKKLSQTALAKAAGLTASEMSRIECGYRDLSTAEAKAIAAALGVSVRDVSGESPGPSEAIPSKTATSPIIPIPESARAPVAPNDLGDPANFREMPDFDLLKFGGGDVEVFRARLRGAVQRATAILHTSKVPANVWRAWRDFERQAQKAFQAPTTHDAVPSVSSELQAEKRALLLAAEKSFQAKRTSRIKHREKSFNALLFDVAHVLLPAEVAGRLTEDAEHRHRSDPSTGFMRHFRAVAEERLAAAELERVARAKEARATKLADATALQSIRR